MRPRVIYAPNLTYLNIWNSAIKINPSILVACPYTVYFIFFGFFHFYGIRNIWVFETVLKKQKKQRKIIKYTIFVDSRRKKKNKALYIS